MLIHFGVVPYIVFDGDYLPSKAATEVERAKRREESKKKGLELYRLNKPSQAHLELQKAVDVSPGMALQLIDGLKKLGVQYVVAPYEADAQLAYLERQGIIQGILSEDSDLLVFGAKRLLTKLDQYGDCIEINRADFTACRDISLVGWSDAEFRRMAILSGCDYLASINRMGLKSAYRLVRKYKTIEKILRMLSFDGQYHVPSGYLEAFYKAELTFLHQRVFCPLKKDIVMMTDMQADAQPEDFSFIGDNVEREIAIGVANGDLDPMTKQPIHVEQTNRIAPRTPGDKPRNNAVNMHPDTKAVKPINSFFKPVRTPLAELDPNSFRPSPTQETLLRQASGLTWESDSAPFVPPSLRPSTSTPSSGPDSTLANRVSKIASSVGGALDESTPSKRRRLCNDPSNREDGASLGASGSEQSRFFAPIATDPGPSIKKSRKNRTRKTDITIWSDDSIEHIMAELSDVTNYPQSSKEGDTAVFKDDSAGKVDDNQWPRKQDDEISREELQRSSPSRGNVTSKVSSITSATNFTGSAPFVAAILDKHVTAELKTLAQDFTYRPEIERMEFYGREMGSSEKIGERVSASQAISKPPMLRQRSTPLERLGLGAMHRSKSCSGLFSSTVNGLRNIEERAPAQGSTPVSKPIPRLPLAYSIGPDASITKGSEDALVPDSEEEDRSASEVEEWAKPQINLERFAFSG